MYGACMEARVPFPLCESQQCSSATQTQKYNKIKGCSLFKLFVMVMILVDCMFTCSHVRTFACASPNLVFDTVDIYG